MFFYSKADFVIPVLGTGKNQTPQGAGRGLKGVAASSKNRLLCYRCLSLNITSFYSVKKNEVAQRRK